MSYSVTHSGQTFVSLGDAGRDFWGFILPIWPIEEYLARTWHGARVAARIKALNPNGRAEGERPRGWYPHSERRYAGRRKHSGVGKGWTE